MINEKAISFRIKPYTQEALLQAGIDIAIMVIIAGVLIAANFPVSICIFIAVGYFAIALAFHYRVMIQALVDKYKGDLITETVSVKHFSEEYSFAGDYLGHSYICKFYPKEMQVQKYRIEAVNNHGEEQKLRSVMSFVRLLQFSILDKQQIEHLQIIYLKRSKILICCDLTEETDKKLSGKRKKTVKKAISFINKSI